MSQPPLLRGSHLPPINRYENLFRHLPMLPESPRTGRGRKPYNRNFLLRALIYRSLRGIPTLSELVFELEENPSLVETLGCDPWRPLPCVERFSHFLRTTQHCALQKIRETLVHELIDLRIIRGRILALDSCPVVVPLRENNLKVRMGHSRFSKDRPPRGDPDVGLGVRVHFPHPCKQQVTFFWGYRNHTVSDAESELTLWEETHPANVSEITRAVPMLRAVQDLALPIEFVTADSEYDAETILHYIAEELHAQPIVPRNPRRQQPTSHRIEAGKIYCAANLPMPHRGKMTNRANGLQYRQFGCPIHRLKTYARQYLFCPIGHPKFFSQKGCNVLIRLTPSIRTQIPYGTQIFEAIFQQRTAIERSYSRLLAINMQHPTVRGLSANRNHCTVAHIATLLVALTAARMGEVDKIRWIKSFVPTFLKT